MTRSMHYGLGLLFCCGVALADNPGLTPLNTLGADSYQGQVGGLYAEGRNEPQGRHAELLRQAAAAVAPLDAEGRPAAAGRIGVIGIGASVCVQVFGELERIGPAAELKRSEVVFINGAKGGQDVSKISDPGGRYWTAAEAAVAAAGLTPAQVQVAWYQSDDLRDTRDDFPGRPQRLMESIAANMRELRQHFPNVRICYHSARHTTAFMPAGDGKAKHAEPRPYHVGWAVKWLIDAQSGGRADLRCDGPDAVAPLVAWAGYFWTNGSEPREDGYRWSPADVVTDGVHLSDAGKQRVAEELLAFWRTDPYAKTWFAGTAVVAPPTSPAMPLKPQVAAAQQLQPGEPALLINGKSKFAKLARLLATDQPVRMVVRDADGKEVLSIDDVFRQRVDLNEKLGPGRFKVHFLNAQGERLKMTQDVPDIVTLK